MVLWENKKYKKLCVNWIDKKALWEAFGKNKTSKIFGCKNKFLIQTNLLYNKNTNKNNNNRPRDENKGYVD